MPENFTALLKALDTEGRTLARPAPATVIETLGRGRRRRRHLTAATSALAVCALAAGVALSAGGAKDKPQPVAPISTSPSASSSAKAAAPTSAHQAAAKNRVGAAALLLGSEPPQPALFQFKAGQARHESGDFSFFFPGCGAADSAKVHAQSAEEADYTATYDMSQGVEVVYHYNSASAARQDYNVFKPNTATCKPNHVVATTSNGFAWENSEDGADMHMMIVLSGTDIAYWSYQYAGNKPYDTSDDQAALQRMADRLDGAIPTPDPVTTPPAGTIPASAWLDLSQIPFGTADQSHGWVPMGTQQEGTTSGTPTANLCAAITDGSTFVNNMKGTIATRNYHGSPSTTPVYPGSNYLYSSAYQNIVTFPGGAVEAQMAFAWTHQVTVAHGCQFKDASGAQTTRKIKVGALVGTAPGTGFSILATDDSGASYEHVYCVVKGAHVAWLMITFEKGDTSTSGDAAVLAAMSARLP